MTLPVVVYDVDGQNSKEECPWLLTILYLWLCSLHSKKQNQKNYLEEWHMDPKNHVQNNNTE